MIACEFCDLIHRPRALAVDRWRILASFEAATGIIMFGWTTALIVAFISRIVSQTREAASPNS